MLLSRANLLASNAAATDSTRYALNGLHVDPDGTTVATDGAQLIAVAPCPADVQDYPGGSTADLGGDGVTIPTDMVNEAAKSIPKRKAKPILENVLLGSDNGTVALSTTDLSRRRSVDCEPVEGNWPDWRDIVSLDRPDSIKVTINPKMLSALLATLARACPRKSVDSAVILEIVDGKAPIMVRAQNEDTGQRALGVLMPMDMSDNESFMEYDAWEKPFASAPATSAK